MSRAGRRRELETATCSAIGRAFYTTLEGMRKENSKCQGVSQLNGRFRRVEPYETASDVANGASKGEGCHPLGSFLRLNNVLVGFCR